jgi:RNA recognition motif-containing protein
MNGWPTQEPSQQENSPDERTTLLLKNIPPSCTTAMLVDMLNSQGFEGCYNFVYAPTDFRSLTSFGYGFVNLVSFNEAVRMMESLDGYDGWASTGINSMEVCWSMPHQGLDLQIRRFQNSPVMHPSVPDEIKPMIFTDGVRSPFPEPTKQLREPRARRPASEML